MIRDTLANSLKDSLKAKDVRRTSTVRLIQTAIKDRDIAHRGTGKDPVSDDEIILSKTNTNGAKSAWAFTSDIRLKIGEQVRLSQVEVPAPGDDGKDTDKTDADGDDATADDAEGKTA